VTSEPPASLLPTSAPQAPPPPPVDPCARAEELSRRALLEADALASSPPEDMTAPDASHAQAAWRALTEPLRHCVRAGDGAWILAPERAMFEWTRGPDVLGNTLQAHRSEISLRPTFVHTDAPPTAGDPLTIGVSALESHAIEITIDGSSDYDGDGTPELVAHTTSQSFESSPSRHHLVVSVVAGRVEPFAPAAGLEIESAIDADEDGLLDFVGIWPGWSAEDCGMDPPVEGRPSVLFHAAHGAFETNDAVAARFLRQRCAPAVDPLVPDAEDCGWFALRRRLACARARGESVVDLTARLDAALKGLSPELRPNDQERAALRAYAAVEPPLTLGPGSSRTRRVAR
jgi:hypothetical protein